MSYSLTIMQKPGYLHAIVTGPNTLENVMAYLHAIESEGISRGCPRVLIEERLDGPRLGTLDVFDLASQGSATPFFEAIAYVDVNAQGDLMKFAENIAVNRGMPVKVFGSVADAERWLLGRR